MNAASRYCENCRSTIDGSHQNRKFCSNDCYEKSRYKKQGSRSTPQQRAFWYKKRKQKPGHMQKLRDQTNKRAKKIREFLAHYKLSIGCADCGYKEHQSALDFDHVRGQKKINVCFSKSISQAKKEIKKCEVVCANCHRVRTYKRFHATYEKVPPDLDHLLLTEIEKLD